MPEKSIEEIVEEFEKKIILCSQNHIAGAFGIDFAENEPVTSWLRTILTNERKQRDEAVKQRGKEVREAQNKHIGNQLLSYYETNIDPEGDLKDKWFVKLVKNLTDVLLTPTEDNQK